jgi:hypothetical protein
VTYLSPSRLFAGILPLYVLFLLCFSFLSNSPLPLNLILVVAHAPHPPPELQQTTVTTYHPREPRSPCFHPTIPQRICPNNIPWPILILIPSGPFTHCPPRAPSIFFVKSKHLDPDHHVNPNRQEQLPSYEVLPRMNLTAWIQRLWPLFQAYFATIVLHRTSSPVQFQVSVSEYSQGAGYDYTDSEGIGRNAWTTYCSVESSWWSRRRGKLRNR